MTVQKMSYAVILRGQSGSWNALGPGSHPVKLSVGIHHLFEAGIANAISSFK